MFISFYVICTTFELCVNTNTAVEASKLRIVCWHIVSNTNTAVEASRLRIVC